MNMFVWMNLRLIHSSKYVFTFPAFSYQKQSKFLFVKKVIIARASDKTMKTSYQEIPGLAAIVEVGVNYTVKLPVEPMLFRLLRVGKLIRAIRMVSWD